MSGTNPSHLLLLRSSRSTQPVRAQPTIVPPISSPPLSAASFRHSGSPPVASFYTSDSSEDGDNSLTEEQIEDPLQVDSTFLQDAVLPGTVRITVESTTFWTHREILYFASPFFEAALSGHWLETGRPASLSSSIITISQPPTVPGAGGSYSTAPVSPETLNQYDNSDLDDFGLLSLSEDEATSDLDSPNVNEAREGAFDKLESSPVETTTTKTAKSRKRTPDAYIELKEEKASTFHDFLKFIYPHLDCVITWNNVEGLMNISHKLVVPTLQSLCLTFLLHHAGAKPIKAMRIAELFSEDELYREASRFVLDNPGGWAESEMKTLSHESLLKLEKRRNWFLERMLKLGSVSIAKEYLCCATCPDTANCARLVEEKWRQGYHALLRFGPPQPSMVFRYLRSLEGISPPLALTHYSCQLCAKAWVSTLFDRMFELGVRGGTEILPLDPRLPNPGLGPRRHFLFCTLKAPDQQRKSRSHA